MIGVRAKAWRSPLLTRGFTVLVVALIVCAAALTQAFGLLRPLDDGLAQLRFGLVQRPASETLTVVEIDPESLKAAGTWPWSRARFAQATDNLMAAGAELVAYDVDFSASSSPEADQAFEASIRRHAGRVVLPTFVQAVRGGAERRLVGSNPLAAFSDEAVLASVNVPVDADGRVRRYRYGYGANEGGRWSMATTLAGAAPGGREAFLLDYGVRLDDIDHLSFEDVYLGRFDPAQVRGRKILIGATAQELGDEFATTRRGTLPGVYIHALAYENLQAGRALGQLPTPVLLLLAAGAAWLLRPRGALELSKVLRRHLLIGAAAILGPLAVQAALPLSIDAGVILATQVLCLVWVVRAELKRRARAVAEAREAHLIQVAQLVRESRNRIRAANRKLKAANDALDKALQARTEFLATTSHEIRTPLNGIMGMTQVILADRDLPQPLRERIGLVHGAGEAMLTIIEDILDMAKIENGNLLIAPADMDLSRLLDETAKLWSGRAAEQGLTLRLERELAPAWIHEDAARLRQIVFNLVSNAIKFTDAGEVALSARAEGETLVLEVSDTGIGIAADKLEEVFESFRQIDGGTTRRHGGTGLGLAISRRLAVAMGGELTVRSVPDQGSTFTLRLPLRRAAPGKSERDARLANASMLLVEANPLAQSVLKAAFAGEGTEVTVAASREEALDHLASDSFGLVVVEGRTLGEAPVAALSDLVQAAAGARVCVLWGGAAGDIPALEGAGPDLIVCKPIGAAELVQRLNGLCDDLPTPALWAAAGR